MKTTLLLAAILLAAAPLAAQPYPTFTDQTFRIGNSWTFDYQESGFDEGGSFTESGREILSIPRVDTFDGREVVIIQNDDTDGDKVELSWIANATEFREVRSQFLPDSGGTGEEIRLSSNSGQPGLLAAPKLLTPGQTIPVDAGSFILFGPDFTESGTAEVEVTFEGIETLLTPLGDFDSARMRWQFRQASGPFTATARRTYWFHPVAGLVGLSVADDFREGGTLVESSSTEYSLVSAVSPGLNRYVTADKLLSRGAVAAADFDPTGDGRLDAADLLAGP